MARTKLGQHFILRVLGHVGSYIDNTSETIKFLAYYMYNPIQKQTQT